MGQPVSFRPELSLNPSAAPTHSAHPLWRKASATKIARTKQTKQTTTKRLGQRSRASKEQSLNGPVPGQAVTLPTLTASVSTLSTPQPWPLKALSKVFQSIKTLSMCILLIYILRTLKTYTETQAKAGFGLGRSVTIFVFSFLFVFQRTTREKR
jgi:hypothetical protein